ncbi:MAG: EutN/CcmL family microcompartment protein [Melioribacteraceae bacterium]|nr:EutN/CcmL family microcompartment protein [Melioribacteraceae bacterium]MCF8356436.1 EutN/CcmL family microcompartment protein [Melioribacteraceae bacterium]MCF8394871.1 EutN/CcmL family microcompartment protein [Melioribacteraceae bacterium]MCF8420599.1 EutN/CcmL family microcompartment protein [Melioribacteraceae bacterium]
MYLAKVKGNIVSTQKNIHLVSHKLLIVQPLDLNGNLTGTQEMIALDQVDAGIGDTVLVAKEGDAVQQILGHKNAPVNTMIIAVVDDIENSEN